MIPVANRKAHRPRRLSDALGNALLLALALTAAIAGSEMLIRVFHGRELGNWGERADFCAYDDTLGWRGIPNLETRFKRRDFSVFVRQNRYGNRGTGYPVERSAANRVVVLGDSYVWGYGVGEEDTFAALLGISLAHTEVINMGCSGYGTDQELLALKMDGLRFSPEVIVLVVTLPSDFTNNIHEVQYSYPKPRFVLTGNELALSNVPVPNRSVAQRLSCYLTRRSALYNYVLERDIQRLCHGRDAGRSRDADEVSITTELIEVIDSLGREQGARALVVLNPTISARTYGMYQSEKVGELGARLVEAGLWVVDLSPRFSAHIRSGEDRLVFEHDSHWNEVGHRLVAEVLREALAGSSSSGAGSSDDGIHAGERDRQTDASASDSGER